jgi:hypothetical protein
MKTFILSILAITFIISAVFVFGFGIDNIYPGNGNIRAYIGGAIGFGIIAGCSLLALIYFLCHYDNKRVSK